MQFPDLAAKANAAGEDIVPIRDVSSNTDKRTTVAGLAGAVAAAIPSGSITPAQRTGGAKIGVISAATFSAVGAKTVTGLGFKPKLIRFTMLPNISSLQAGAGGGAVDASGTQYWYYTSVSGTNMARETGQTACIVARANGSNLPLFTAQWVSMDDDGFTINVTTANAGAYPVAYEAMA